LSVLLATITQCKVASGTFVMLASTVHNVAKYYQKALENTKYQRPKRSSNKIRILQTKFEFAKKTNLTSLVTTQTEIRIENATNCIATIATGLNSPVDIVLILHCRCQYARSTTVCCLAIIQKLTKLLSCIFHHCSVPINCPLLITSTCVPSVIHSIPLSPFPTSFPFPLSLLPVACSFLSGGPFSQIHLRSL